MVNLSDLGRLARRLPGTITSKDGLVFSLPVKGKLKGYAWIWWERVAPKKARVHNLAVVVIRVRSLSEKDILLGSGSAAFFTEPHYNGYPAIHVHLESVEVDELEDLLTSAWKTLASPTLIQEFESH